MKPRYKAAIGMFGLVVLGGLVSAGVFVWIGSQMAVYATVGIVPLLAVAGLLWVRTTVQQTGVNEQRYTKQRAREVGEAFTDFWTMRERMRDAHPSYFVTDDPGIESVVSDLETEGVLVDLDSASFSLSDPGELESLNRIQSDIDDLADERDRQFIEGVRNDVESLNRSVSQLSDITTVDTELDAEDVPADPSDVDPDGTEPWWETLDGRLADHERSAEESIRRALDSVRSTLAVSDDVDTSQVNQELENAEAALGDRRYEEAVDHVLNARERFRQSGSDSFRSGREELLALVEAVRSADVERYVDEETFAELDRCEESIEDLEDATEMATLDDLRSALRDVCIDIVVTLESELDRYLSILDQEEPPAGFYQRPDAADEDYTALLRETDSITAFRHAFEQAIEELEGPLSTLETKADVIQAYPQMADRMEERLRTEGRVTADDLPVKRDEEKYMGLYARQHADVEFDPTEPSLTASTDVTTHTLTVEAAFESGGPERGITIEIDGDQYADSESGTTHLLLDRTFEDVPAGEYEVRAVPDTDTHEAVSETVTVEANREVALEISDVALRERVCDGVDVDIDGLLTDFGPRIEDRFETEDYVSTSMSFQIDAEYVPCLLVTWADRTGYETLESDDEIIIYDDETLMNEIENVIRYNIDPGEELTFEKLRTKYLSVPASDTVLRDLVAGSTAADDVTLTESGIRKEGED